MTLIIYPPGGVNYNKIKKNKKSNKKIIINKEGTKPINLINMEGTPPLTGRALPNLINAVRMLKSKSNAVLIL